MRAIRTLTSIMVLCGFLTVAASLNGYTRTADYALAAMSWIAHAFPYLFVAALVLGFLRSILLGNRA